MIILLMIFIILLHIKNILLYHPTISNSCKYDKFYCKLLNLCETTDHINNHQIKTRDNILLDAVSIKNPGSDKYIIFFHGNAGNLSMRFDMIKFLYNYASVLIFDYRSFGKSSGDSSNLSSRNLLIDADAVWNFVIKELKINANCVSFFGESLGCSVAIALASKLSKEMNNNNYPHSLILNSPFYSLGSMIEHLFDKFNGGILGKGISFFLGREYPTFEWIKYINHQTKIIIAHSPRDEIIPYQQGWKLYSTISATHPSIQFININGTHNNMALTDQYIYALADLFDDQN